MCICIQPIWTLVLNCGIPKRRNWKQLFFGTHANIYSKCLALVLFIYKLLFPLVRTSVLLVWNNKKTESNSDFILDNMSCTFKQQITHNTNMLKIEFILVLQYLILSLIIFCLHVAFKHKRVTGWSCHSDPISSKVIFRDWTKNVFVFRNITVPYFFLSLNTALTKDSCESHHIIPKFWKCY